MTQKQKLIFDTYILNDLERFAEMLYNGKEIALHFNAGKVAAQIEFITAAYGKSNIMVTLDEYLAKMNLPENKKQEIKIALLEERRFCYHEALN